MIVHEHRWLREFSAQTKLEFLPACIDFRYNLSSRCVAKGVTRQADVGIAEPVEPGDTWVLRSPVFRGEVSSEGPQNHGNQQAHALIVECAMV